MSWILRSLSTRIILISSKMFSLRPSWPFSQCQIHKVFPNLCLSMSKAENFAHSKSNPSHSHTDPFARKFFLLALKLPSFNSHLLVLVLNSETLENEFVFLIQPFCKDYRSSFNIGANCHHLVGEFKKDGNSS